MALSHFEIRSHFDARRKRNQKFKLCVRSRDSAVNQKKESILFVSFKLHWYLSVMRTLEEAKKLGRESLEDSSAILTHSCASFLSH